MTIELKKIEHIFQLKPKEVAAMAGITTQHYYSVRSADGQLSQSALFQLIFNLAEQADYQGMGRLFNQARRAMIEIQQKLEVA